MEYRSNTSCPGEFVAAAIESVGRFNDLVLVVDPSDGSTLIQNQSAQSIELISYTISSESDSLLSSWSGLQGLGEPGWFKANGTASDLSELASANPLVLGEGEQRNLGFAWNTSGDDDLTFVYQDPTTGQLIDGTVHFGLPENISVGLDGDFNHDGTVDAADYVVWRKNDGGPDGYAEWRANFGMTELGIGNGAAANSSVAIANQPVPEPTTCLLALLGTAPSLRVARPSGRRKVYAPMGNWLNRVLKKDASVGHPPAFPGRLLLPAE